MRHIIALTGGTGFIGSTLARRLVRVGWQVRALVRPSSDRAHLTGISIEWIEGALEEPSSLQHLVRGAQVVIHCAGAVRGMSQAHFHRVNAEGVTRLAHIATKQQPTPNFLLISSLAAREPALSPYAASKWQGEVALATAANEMKWTVLRPTAVYGPGDREFLPLFRWMVRGIAPVLGEPHARFSLLYIEDLVDAVMQWLDTGDCGRGPFELDDGHPNGYSWNDVADTIARLCDKRMLRVHVPTRALDLLARLNLMISRLVGHTPMLTPGKVRELRHPNWLCDNSAFTRETNWMPKVSFEQGIRQTLGFTIPLHNA